MGLIIPDFGLVIWMMVSFLILLLVLRKFAWKPILTTLRNREESISKALTSAAEAEKKLADLKSESEQILNEARKERDMILREARDAKDKIIGEAREKAQEESARLLASARENIENEKMKALTELRNQVATLSIDIAEKILREKMATGDKQQEVVDKILKEVTLN